MFMMALFVTAKKKTSQIPSTAGWVNKLYNILPRKCYLAIKRNEPLI